MNFKQLENKLYDRLACRPIQQPEKLSKRKDLETLKMPVQGEVIAIGPGKYDKKNRLVPLKAKIGNKVAYYEWDGTEINTEDMGIVVLVRESDVLAIIDEKDQKEIKQKEGN